MIAVANPGGTAARIAPASFPVALKTGTASEPGTGFHVNYIGFGPVPETRFAFAVRVTHQPSSRRVRTRGVRGHAPPARRSLPLRRRSSRAAAAAARARDASRRSGSRPRAAVSASDPELVLRAPSSRSWRRAASSEARGDLHGHGLIPRQAFGWKSSTTSSARSATPLWCGCRGSRPRGAPLVGQARVVQPGRLGQGPHRHLDDRGRRGERRASPGNDHRRADLGQHRDRPRHRRRAQGLQAGVHRVGEDLEGEDRAARGVRRARHRLPARGPGRRSALVLQGGGAAARRGGRLPPVPVLQPGQPDGALPHHRSGDLAADRRHGDALGRGHGHRRDHQRRRAASSRSRTRRSASSASTRWEASIATTSSIASCRRAC